MGRGHLAQCLQRRWRSIAGHLRGFLSAPIPNRIVFRSRNYPIVSVLASMRLQFQTSLCERLFHRQSCFSNQSPFAQSVHLQALHQQGMDRQRRGLCQRCDHLQPMPQSLRHPYPYAQMFREYQHQTILDQGCRLAPLGSHKLGPFAQQPMGFLDPGRQYSVCRPTIHLQRPNRRLLLAPTYQRGQSQSRRI